MYPPLGNGVKAASEGLVPVPGAIATGQITNTSSLSPDQSSTNGTDFGDQDLSRTRTPSQQIADTHRQFGNDKSGTHTTEDVGGETVRAEKDQVNGGLAGQMAQTSLGGGSGGGGVGTAEEDLVTETKPGAPVGEVVFDHPPSHGELEEVRKSMEGGR
jgi:hypothetical protein